MANQSSKARLSARPDGYVSEIRRDGLLWYGVLGGPTAWGIHLGLSYFLVYVLCGTGYTWLLHFVTLGMLTVAGGAFAVAWQQYNIVRARDPERTDYHWQRVRFMGRMGVWMSALFGAAVLVGGIPIFFVDLCNSVA